MLACQREDMGLDPQNLCEKHNFNSHSSQRGGKEEGSHRSAQVGSPVVYRGEQESWSQTM